MEKIKILQINKLYYPSVGGIERTVQNIAEGLNGVDVYKRQDLLVIQEGTNIEKESAATNCK